MDALDVILLTVRDELLRIQPANAERFAAALSEAEIKARRILGGTKHHIPRLPKKDTLHTVQALPANLTPAQVAARAGISVAHARRMLRLVERRTAPNDPPEPEQA